MPLWLTLALLSVITVSSAEIVQKVTLTNKINISSITNNFYVWLVMGLLASFTSAIFRFQFPTDFVFSISNIVKFLAVGITYFLGGSFYYQSYKGNSVSLSVILASITSVITVAAGIVFFNESTSILKFVGGGTILSAIIVANYSSGQKLNKYNLYAFLGGMFYGVAYTMDKSFMYSFNPIIYQTIICFLIAGISFVIKSKQIISESKLINKVAVKSIILASIFFYLFQVFLFNAYKYNGEVGKINLIANASIFVVFILEVVLLKERKNLKKKILASIIATIGATILAFAR